jgi:hypothetical protein
MKLNTHQKSRLEANINWLKAHWNRIAPESMIMTFRFSAYMELHNKMREAGLKIAERDK